MSYWWTCCVLYITLFISGCSSSPNYKTLGETPQQFVDSVPSKDFNLNHIESIILFMDDEIIASIHPLSIQQGTKQPERQCAGWQLMFLNERHIYKSLNENDARLLIDRITPKSPTDRRIMLNPGPQVINIGGFDHTLIISQSKNNSDQHLWVYWSGAGERCDGTVAFVIRD